MRVSVEHSADRFSVVVWNEGPGFPDSQRGRLFRKFSRLDTPELRERKGTGVGLYTSWRIVQPARRPRRCAVAGRGLGRVPVRIPQPLASAGEGEPR